MLRHFRSDTESVRRIRIARARRAFVLMMTLAFATFISVANATAEDLGAAPEQQPTGEVTILVPAEQPAPAPIVDPVPAPEPAPVVEAAPAPVEVAAPEPVVETAKEQVKVESVKDPAPIHVAAQGDINCPNGSEDNKVSTDLNGDGGVTLADCRPAKPGVIQHKPVTICHANNGSGSGFYNVNTVDDDSIFKQGHGDHDDDIIPSFTYTTGYAYNWTTLVWNPVTVTHPGKNDDGPFTRVVKLPGNVDYTWTINGATAAASLSSATPTCPSDPTQVNPPAQQACPAGTTDFDPGAALDCRPPKPTAPDLVTVCHKNGDGTFSPQTWTISGAVDVEHGLDLSDVIPGFTYTLGWTWDSTSKLWEKNVGTFTARNTGAIQTTINFPIVGNLTFDLNGTTLLGSNCGTPTPNIPAKPTVKNVKVTICDQNSGNGSDFYNLITVDENAILRNGNGHDGHQYDIIPSFTYTTGFVYNQTTSQWDEQTANYAGKNLSTFQRQVHFPHTGNITWTIDGAAVGAKLAAGTATPADCGPANPPAQPDVPLVPVRLCHLNGFNSWAPVLVADARTIVAPGGHASHTFDVIPAFTYTTGYTYSVGTSSWTAVTAPYAGKNLGNQQGFLTNRMTGTARLATNGCAPGKPAIYTEVPVCNSGGNGVFALQTWAISNGDVAAGHGADADDVIPPFAYVDDYDWQVGLGWVPQFKTFSGRNLGLFNQTVNVPGTGNVSRTFSGAGLLLSGCNVPAIPAKPNVQRVPVQICHANNGVGSAFYNVITVDDDAILDKGHDGHDNDIIPAFPYTTGLTYSSLLNAWAPQTATYAGKNLSTFQRQVHFPHTGNITWTIDGAAVGTKLAAKTAVDADCSPADPPAKPPVAAATVTVCHATTDLNGFDTFVPASWTIVNGNVNAGHGLDSGDIIPSFAYIVDYTYDVVTNSWNPVYAKPDYPGQNLGTFTRTMNLPVVGSVPWSLTGASMLANQNCGITQPAPKPPVTATPVSLCHASTLAGFDSYVKFVGTSDDVIGAGTHGGDASDVIPAFTYTTGFTFDPATNVWNPVTHSYAGQNLGTFVRTINLPVIGSVTRTFDGTKMLASGCQVPSLPLRPDIAPVTVAMCHAYVLDGRDYYSTISTGHASVLGATGHDADANDVIPAFTYTTGHTYDHVTNSWIAQTASYAGKNLGSFTRTVNLASGPATLAFDGTAMLAAGTCPTPTVPTTADTTPTPTPTPDPDVPGGGDEPDVVDADPIEPDVEADSEEPAEQPAAEDENALPFTGLELGALLLIGFGAVGAGAMLHGGRRRRRVAARD